ncbi:MAG: hypothetical protein ACJA0I_001296 [Gammaproteobacteria bacterium]|jgi:hypothetical protein
MGAALELTARRGHYRAKTHRPVSVNLSCLYRLLTYRKLYVLSL